MKNVFAWLLAAFVACARAQSDATTDCAKMDFVTLANDCCKNPFPKLFPSSLMLLSLKTCNASCSSIKWLNSYQLNKLQKQSLENFIDLTAPTTISELCTAGAYIECFFKQNNWLNDTGFIQTTELSTHLTGLTADTTWQKIIGNVMQPIDPLYAAVFYDFTDMVVDKYESITCPSGKVNLRPLMMAQMLQSEFIWMCPQQNPYTAANKCTEKMRNYLFCDGKIYSPLGKGVYFFSSI